MKHICPEETDQGLFVKLRGDVEFSDASELHDTLIRCIHQYSLPILIDLKDVHYIDSSGLSALRRCVQEAQKISRDVQIADISEDCYEIFMMTQFMDQLKFLRSSNN